MALSYDDRPALVWMLQMLPVLLVLQTSQPVSCLDFSKNSSPTHPLSAGQGTLHPHWCLRT